MGQSLFEKHAKFQKLNEILYCGMTRFRNVKSGVFRQYQNTKTIKKIIKRRKSFLETFKITKFQLRNFI